MFIKNICTRLLGSYSLKFFEGTRHMYTHACSFKMYILNITQLLIFVLLVTYVAFRQSITETFLKWKLSFPSSLFLFPYGTKPDGPFLFPLRLVEGYGIVCLTLSSLEDRSIRRTKGDPSRKTRQRARRSTGLSILFPEFLFGSLSETLTARRKPIH